MPDPDARRPRNAAVIDVGSNSVRLVLYRLEGRSIWTVYNEKLLAGLGRDLSRTGKLSPEGVKIALQALRRFRAVLDATRPDDVFAVATAAVREASDGPAFVKQAKAEAKVKIRVLSGEEEAHYSALGVAAGIPDALGVAGDLGGFSLELVRLKNAKTKGGVTLPLGPFALRTGGSFDAAEVLKEARRRLAPVARDFQTDTFYAVGGAWRNLALIHMRLNHYPLHIVHEFDISARDFHETAQFVARQSRTSLESIQGLTKKRIDSLPYSAMALSALIEELRLKKIVICAWGLREGMLFESMPGSVRKQDPLVEGCASLGLRHDQAEEMGSALEAWLTPALKGLPPVFEEGRDAVMIAAACRLADLGARLHPDHRADLVFEQVLRAPIPGMTHAERAFLATAAFCRHTAVANPPEPKILSRLLSDERMQRAKALGAAVRLGCDLSGRSAVLLAGSSLDVREDKLVLTARPEHADLLLGEQTNRRALTLAGLLGRELRVAAG